jgi:hypothetical protein
VEEKKDDTDVTIQVPARAVVVIAVYVPVPSMRFFICWLCCLLFVILLFSRSFQDGGKTPTLLIATRVSIQCLWSKGVVELSVLPPSVNRRCFFLAGDGNIIT